MIKVEKYLIPEASTIKVDYSLFDSCDTMPVVYNNKPYAMHENKWVEIPTRIIIHYLRELYQMPKNVVLGERCRTVKVITLENNKKLYIIPNIKQSDSPSLKCEVPFSLHTNPEINKMIVEQLKTYRFR